MSRFQIALAGSGIALIIIASIIGYDHMRTKPMATQMVKIWQQLPASETGCPDSDYWPDGGMRSFYCHLRTLISYEKLQKSYGGSPFLSGPHTAKIDLESETSFAHYRPDFVQWLQRMFIPRDADLQAKLRPVFQGYIEKLALLYMKAILRLEAQPIFYEQEVRYTLRYLEMPDKLSNTRPLDRFEGIMFDEEYPSSALAFWVRRRIDGTDQLFKEALVELLEQFVPDKLQNLKRTDWGQYIARSTAANAMIDYDAGEEGSQNSIRFDNQSTEAAFKNLWTSVPDSKNQCPNQFDYFPQGGLRVYFCHAIDIVSLGELRRLAGFDIFVSGPHKADSLDLENNRDFGRYNPKFVRWGIDNFLPDAKDTMLAKRAEFIYRDHIGPAARTFFTVLKLTEAMPTEYRSSFAEYKTFIQSGGDAMPDFEWFSNRLYELEDGQLKGTIDSNFASTAVSFWMRREMDGTKVLFEEAFHKLIKTFDQGFMDSLGGVNLVASTKKK